ncbi:hypothetical protein U7230_07280 [Carboxydochorda subterranea]|uniref:Uncharacterized protein n=1 Tax=Carboxydichorda subterranea TaxID=3109565 RepID=A0ABZ1C1P7_9FIRM|nr:hypothetical protein [Limnochorda sp. L945t]WRP18785.1 hypothetical protein U7230_07280 [Limnochorda sp. L945t]
MVVRLFAPSPLRRWSLRRWSLVVGRWASGFVVVAAAVAVAVTALAAPAGAQEGWTVWVAPMYGALSGADLHILDEVLETVTTEGQNLTYSAQITPRWFRPGPTLVPRLGASVGISSRLSVAAEGLFLGWHDSATRRFEAPADTATTDYANSVFLWEGNWRLPDQRAFGLINVTHPSGWSPIDWHADGAIQLASGTLGARALLFNGGNLQVAAEGGVAVFHLDHRFDRRWAGVAESPVDANDNGRIDPEPSPDYYLRNNVSLDQTASSTGTALGPSMGLRLQGRLGGTYVEASASQGWASGQFALASRFVDIDDQWFDDNQDGTFDRNVVLHGDVPFRQQVPATIPVTQLHGTLRYPLGPVSVGAGVFYSLHRNVPVSPELSYRDYTFKPRTQDISISGAMAFVQASF